jgi:HAMP domain-containing protein
MKSDTTTTVLNFVLVLLAISGVACAFLTIKHTRELRQLNNLATVDRDLILRVDAVANEVNAYNQKSPSPELTRILQQPAQTKPAAK